MEILNTIFQYNQIAYEMNYSLFYKINYNKILQKESYILYNNKYLLNKILLKHKQLYFKIKNYNIFIYYLKKLGFIKSIKYLLISFNNDIYTIFNIKLNPIIIKINIKNYKNLTIPKFILIKQFSKQIGMPINYKLLEYNIQEIYKWYQKQGFKWVNIKYIYNIKNQEITFFIDEGKIYNIYIKNSHSKYKISIKKILIFYGQILNIYQLDNQIFRLKKIYNIKYLNYYIQHTSKGLKIRFIDEERHNKLLYIYIYNFIQNLQSYKFSKYLNFQYLYSLFCLIKKKIQSIDTIFEYQSYNYYWLYCINAYLRYSFNYQISNHIDCIKIYILIIPDQKFLAKNISLYIFFYLQNKLNSDLNFSLNKNIYKITNLEIKIESNIINTKKFIIQKYIYYQRYIKLCFYNKYKNIIKFYKIKNIQNIQYQNNYNNIKKDNLLKKNFLLNIEYNIYLYYPEWINHLSKFLYYYNHYIKIQYKKKYINSRIYFFKNSLNLFSELNIFMKNIQNILSNNYNIFNIHAYTIKLNLLLDIEYQILKRQYNCIYIFINYLPLKKQHFIYSLKYNILYHKQIIKLGLGIQVNLPIKYLPIIRLESRFLSNKNIIFYTYLISKFYH